MHALIALIAVVTVGLGAWLAALQPSLRYVLGVTVPPCALVVFLAGFARRVLQWAASPVPFRIPVTAGQQASLPWLTPARIDNPSTSRATIARMAIEVLLFRSLLRSAAAEKHASGRLIFRQEVALWAAALAFHYSLLIVVLRHLRLAIQPVPGVISWLASVDGFFQVGVPPFYLTDLLLPLALGYLLARRLVQAPLRTISLFSDYVPLFLLLGVAVTGLLMRYFVPVDVVAVKEFVLSLVTLSPPKVAPSLHPLVFAHLALASTLVVLFPFSKLMHMAGVFLSPTRNLANNSRAARHVNPWNAPVKVHTYEEWEDEFRDKMIAAGIPVEGGSEHV